MSEAKTSKPEKTPPAADRPNLKPPASSPESSSESSPPKPSTASEPAPASDESEGLADSEKPRPLLVVAIVGGLTLMLVAIALLLFIVLKDTELNIFSGGKADPGIPLEVVKITPTIPVSPLPLPTCETIISSGDVEIAAPLPVTLTVVSETFPVEAIVPQGERGWSYPAGRSEMAAWICGTVVNYVLAMEPTPENAAILNNLRLGDEITLELTNGVKLLFRFAERREATAEEVPGLFMQLQPRLTLFIEQGAEGGGGLQVVKADYVSETEPIEPPAGELAQPGQPVQVGNAEVTVVEGYAQRSDELPPETMYYLVEFSLKNVGEVPLETDAFAMQLKDGVENAYLPSPDASAAGKHGPLSGEIEPGATVQGTAGYLVPDPLSGPTLIWSFAPGPASESQARVSIPHEPQVEEEAPPAGQAEVNVTDAFLNNDRTVLIIEGEVRNKGEQPLTVEVGDVMLTSSAGMGSLRMAAPPLPWVIEPGQSQVIELQYEKPGASTVLLEVLGYSFEIQGL